MGIEKIKDIKTAKSYADDISKNKIREYQKKYHKDYYKKQKELNSPDKFIRAIARIRKLSTEIGTLNADRVIKVLEEIRDDTG